MVFLLVCPLLHKGVGEILPPMVDALTWVESKSLLSHCLMLSLTLFGLWRKEYASLVGIFENNATNLLRFRSGGVFYPIRLIRVPEENLGIRH